MDYEETQKPRKKKGMEDPSNFKVKLINEIFKKIYNDFLKNPFINPC